MGWASVSERDLRRIEVLSDLRTGRLTVAAAATVLAVSERQTRRLLARYELDGGSGLIPQGSGPNVEPEPERRPGRTQFWRPRCSFRNYLDSGSLLMKRGAGCKSV
jgi:hypothetical protein